MIGQRVQSLDMNITSNNINLDTYLRPSFELSLEVPISRRLFQLFKKIYRHIYLSIFFTHAFTRIGIVFVCAASHCRSNTADAPDKGEPNRATNMRYCISQQKN